MVGLGEVKATAFCQDTTAVVHQLRLLLWCPYCVDKNEETCLFGEMSAEEMHLSLVLEYSPKLGKSRPGIQNFEV